MPVLRWLQKFWLSSCLAPSTCNFSVNFLQSKLKLDQSRNFQLWCHAKELKRKPIIRVCLIVFSKNLGNGGCWCQIHVKTLASAPRSQRNPQIFSELVSRWLGSIHTIRANRREPGRQKIRDDAHSHKPFTVAWLIYIGELIGQPMSGVRGSTLDVFDCSIDLYVCAQAQRFKNWEF